MIFTSIYNVLHPKNTKQNDDSDNESTKLTAPRPSSPSSNTSESSSSAVRFRRAKFERLDSPMMEMIEKGSAKKQFDN
jgi:hypothetical protein